MKVLYIGQYSPGSTSKMRADIIKHHKTVSNFEVIDTNIPFFKTHKLWRTIGFRYKIGHLIKTLNSYILENLDSNNSFTYDLIWADKAVFITPKTTAVLRSKCKKLLHFTPDMAFLCNQSLHFEKSLTYYDFLITTKSAEKEIYLKKIPEHKLIVTTQGYSKNIHKSYHDFEEKEKCVVFIGLAEPKRFEIVQSLIDADINVKLVGKKWKPFLDANKTKDALMFLGETIFDEDYSRLLSSSLFALGLLSKRFPEFHTTRTFEIPACGTALLTERNKEIESFFKEDEVVFYSDTTEMIRKIKYYSVQNKELEVLTKKGEMKVKEGGFDYETIIGNVIKVVKQ